MRTARKKALLMHFGTARAVRADDEAVNLVAEALEVEQHRRIDRQRQFAAVHQVEYLAPLAAVMRPLGDAD